MKIYFDTKGRIRAPTVPDGIITQGDHNSAVIEAYADFDVTSYFASITLKRADGVILGPYSMTPVVGIDGVTIAHYEYYLQSTDTAVAGALNMTIKYETYQVDEETGEMVATYTKACGMIAANIGQAVIGENNVILNMQHRLTQLEEDVAELEAKDGDYDELTVSSAEPTNKTVGHVWFKIV